MAKHIENRIKMQSTLLILSLIAILLVLLSTSRYGVGLSPDSAIYISVAKNLLSGNGYREFGGIPFVNWAPLFPTLLAILGLLGISPLDGARLINA